MLIVATVMMLSIPAIGSITRAKLRSQCGKLAGQMRGLYGEAALRGQTCRMVLDLDANAWWSECAAGRATIAAKEDAHNGARDDEDKPALSRSEVEAAVRAQLDKKAAFAPAGEKVKLDGLTFSDVWVQHQPEAYVKGTAFIYFFAGGQTEKAHVHLTDGNDTYTLLVSPLTGRVRVVNEKVDAKDDQS